MEKYEYLTTITFEMVKDRLPKRFAEAHKGTFGKLLCICGSKDMPGAAYFNIASAVKSGVGLVEAVIPESIYIATSKKISEAIFCVVDDDEQGFISETSIDIILEKSKKSTAILAGCGMGWNHNTRKIVFELIRNSKVPIIIDADGINVISENIDILKEAHSSIVLTPHLKEMSRLTGESIEYLAANKVKCTQSFSERYGVITVLKGNQTVISDGKNNIFLNLTGNSGMAKGGTGDVLAGMIGSFASQRLSLLDAVLCGVFIHGIVGDKCAQKFSRISMTPSNMIEELSNVFLKFE